jgi:hypothetical protein
MARSPPRAFASRQISVVVYIAIFIRLNIIGAKPSGNFKFLTRHFGSEADIAAIGVHYSAVAALHITPESRSLHDLELYNIVITRRPAFVTQTVKKFTVGIAVFNFINRCRHFGEKRLQGEGGQASTSWLLLAVLAPRPLSPCDTQHGMRIEARIEDKIAVFIFAWVQSTITVI